MSLKSLGLRHVALNVSDPQASKKFYVDVMKMTVEWEPDVDNIYLTSDSQDNLAIHRSDGKPKASQALDHIGFFVPAIEDVDSWYEHVKSFGVKIVREVKTHRDGARSFYFEDPDKIVIQILFHSPIAKHG